MAGAPTTQAYLSPVFSTLLLLIIAGEHLHAATALAGEKPENALQFTPGRP